MLGLRKNVNTETCSALSPARVYIRPNSQQRQQSREASHAKALCQWLVISSTKGDLCANSSLPLMAEYNPVIIAIFWKFALMSPGNTDWI